MQPKFVAVKVPEHPAGAVLVLHGGASRRENMMVSPTQLSVLRMIPIARRIALAAVGNSRCSACSPPGKDGTPGTRRYTTRAGRWTRSPSGSANRCRPAWSGTRSAAAPHCWPRAHRRFVAPWAGAVGLPGRLLGTRDGGLIGRIVAGEHWIQV